MERSIPEMRINEEDSEGEKNPEFSPTQSLSSSTSSSPTSASALLESDNNENNLFGYSSGKSKLNENLSPVYEHQWSMSSGSEQSEGYDPNRIPASVFSRRQTGSSDWSANSNESLFSIHMGSNSFSEENGAPFRGGGGKSVDISWIDEDCTSSHNSISEPKSLSPLIEGLEDSSPESRSSSGHELRDSNSSSKIPKGVNMESLENQKMTRDDEAIHPPVIATIDAPDHSAETTRMSSRLSNDSGNSNHSFAFPVLANDGGKSASINWAMEKKPSEKPQLVEQQQCTPDTHKASGKRRFCGFSCWQRRCCCC